MENREKSLELLVYTPYYKPGYKGGGPIKSIFNMAASCRDFLQLKIVTLNHDLGMVGSYREVEDNTWVSRPEAVVKYIPSGFAHILKLVKPLIRDNYDILYLNSFFSIKFSVIPLICALCLGRAVVLAPRGELSKGALAIKAKKKHLFIYVVQFLALYNKVVFHATSDEEKEDISSVFPRAKVLLASNITLNQMSCVTPQTRIKEKGHVKLVFVSRISEKKNLLFAIRLLKDLVGIDVVFDIYGPIEDEGYWHDCEKEISTLPSNISVKHMGELNPNSVGEVLNDYDGFLFPTLGENYGHAIVEAMLAGLPVIISDTTPWRGLSNAGLGWDLSLKCPLDYRKAIYELADMNDKDMTESKSRVRNWAESKFYSKQPIEDTRKLFQSIDK